MLALKLKQNECLESMYTSKNEGVYTEHKNFENVVEAIKLLAGQCLSKLFH